jgi:hypothetical protein
MNFIVQGMFRQIIFEDDNQDNSAADDDDYDEGMIMLVLHILCY